MPVKVEFVDPKDSGELGTALGELLRRLMTEQQARQTQDDSQDPDHKTECACSDCQVRRFQVPTPPPDDNARGVLEILLLLTQVRERHNSICATAKKASTQFVLDPPPKAAEDIILQMFVESVNTSVRAFNALVELLPEASRPPAHVCGDIDIRTLDEAKAMMVAARVTAQKTFDEHKAAAEAKAAAAAAVDAAAAAVNAAGGEG